MKKIVFNVGIILAMFVLTGCGKNEDYESLSENVKRLELTGNLVTYEAYYHNVLEFEKEAGKGITHVFEKDRKLFAEYTGTIKLGIDLNKVKVEINGKEINVKIPAAKIIGQPNVDKDDFKKEKFIESEEGFINKNPINGDDISKAFDDAQAAMKKYAEDDEELLAIAQKRAKIIIEENINQFSGMKPSDYTINWEYES